MLKSMIYSEAQTQTSGVVVQALASFNSWSGSNPAEVVCNSLWLKIEVEKRLKSIIYTLSLITNAWCSGRGFSVNYLFVWIKSLWRLLQQF